MIVTQLYQHIHNGGSAFTIKNDDGDARLEISLSNFEYSQTVSTSITQDLARKLGQSLIDAAEQMPKARSDLDVYHQDGLRAEPIYSEEISVDKSTKVTVCIGRRYFDSRGTICKTEIYDTPKIFSSSGIHLDESREI